MVNGSSAPAAAVDAVAMLPLLATIRPERTSGDPCPRMAVAMVKAWLLFRIMVKDIYLDLFRI